MLEVLLPDSLQDNFKVEDLQGFRRKVAIRMASFFGTFNRSNNFFHNVRWQKAEPLFNEPNGEQSTCMMQDHFKSKNLGTVEAADHKNPKSIDKSTGKWFWRRIEGVYTWNILKPATKRENSTKRRKNTAKLYCTRKKFYKKNFSGFFKSSLSMQSSIAAPFSAADGVQAMHCLAQLKKDFHVSKRCLRMDQFGKGWNHIIYNHLKNRI